VIESVPNLSEGRDAGAIERVADVARASDCRVLDVHQDPDHHRSVLTIVGERSVIAEGIFAMVEAATRSIDLRRHRGAHPRMGAVDVVPFVPLRGSAIEECVDAAKAVGAMIAEGLGIPVFLYGAAATRSDRRNLAKVRRGGLAAVAKRIRTPGEGPDYGPARVHPTAGAIAVGARRFLVAYNVNLDTDDVAVAREIASAVREAGGGLPGVKALGIPLASRRLAQVSMNLTDVGATTVAEAFARVREEASHRGVRVLESEIVGLAPRVALRGASTEGLRLTRNLAEVVLETRIEAE